MHMWCIIAGREAELRFSKVSNNPRVAVGGSRLRSSVRFACHEPAGTETWEAGRAAAQWEARPRPSAVHLARSRAPKAAHAPSGLVGKREGASGFRVTCPTRLPLRKPLSSASRSNGRNGRRLRRRESASGLPCPLEAIVTESVARKGLIGGIFFFSLSCVVLPVGKQHLRSDWASTTWEPGAGGMNLPWGKRKNLLFRKNESTLQFLQRCCGVGWGFRAGRGGDWGGSCAFTRSPGMPERVRFGRLATRWVVGCDSWEEDLFSLFPFLGSSVWGKRGSGGGGMWKDQDSQIRILRRKDWKTGLLIFLFFFLFC